MSLNRRHICGTTSGFARQLKDNLVAYYALKIDNGGYSEVQVIAPPTYYGVRLTIRAIFGKYLSVSFHAPT